MGLLDKIDERKITIQDLKNLGFYARFNGSQLNYWFHGGGSSYVKVTMSVDVKAYKSCGYISSDSQVEKFIYCVSDDGSRYFIKSIDSPTLDDLEIVWGVVKQQKWRF